jgi:hypothetical protein
MILLSFLNILTIENRFELVMTQIAHGVIYCDDNQPVLHLYREQKEAVACANAYQALGIRALVAKIEPPLATSRPSDQWGVYDEQAQCLYVCQSIGVAYGVSATGPTAAPRLVVQIRQAQPINAGTPQFAPILHHAKIACNFSHERDNKRIKGDTG